MSPAIAAHSTQLRHVIALGYRHVFICSSPAPDTGPRQAIKKELFGGKRVCLVYCADDFEEAWKEACGMISSCRPGYEYYMSQYRHKERKEIKSTSSFYQGHLDQT